MSPRLFACASCGRHVFALDPKCPFCHALPEARAVAKAAALGLVLAACHRDAPTTTADPGASATPPASATPSAAPSTSTSALDNGNLSNPDAGGLGALGTLGKGLMREQAAVYGPPPTRLGPTGQATYGTIQATVPVANSERVLASARARMRSLYQRTLAEDPSMKGQVTFTVKVAADGSVASVDAKSVSGLSASLVEDMKHVLQNSQFEGPGKPSVLTVPVTLAPTPP